MFALSIRYLNGWSMAAADGARKERTEWPPHPDRVFMALAAAWFETNENTDDYAREGDALRWLQTLPPPAIAASEANDRTVVTSYVPVNDVATSKKVKPKADLVGLREQGLVLLPEHRLRQPRAFPVAIPRWPVARLIWHDTGLDAHRGALERLTAKVSHVGHSASFVQAWVEPDCVIRPVWEPTEGVAVHRMRVPSPGRLDRLARPSEKHTEAIEQAEANLKEMTPPPRKRWRLGFPDAILLADESSTKRHTRYAAAKTGDDLAAVDLVDSLVDEAGVAAARWSPMRAKLTRHYLSAHTPTNAGASTRFPLRCPNCWDSVLAWSSAPKSRSRTSSLTPVPTVTDA